MAAVAERCGEGTHVGECDVSDNEAVTAAIDAAADALGGLDAVVANAGIAAGGPLKLQDVRAWERVIEINLLGVMYTDRAALPHLERSQGYLLNIASTAAVLRAPGLSAYCAAKAGVEALSDCLRIEMQPFGVQVGVAYFLFLDTDMVRDAEREMPLLQRSKSECRTSSPAPTRWRRRSTSSSPRSPSGAAASPTRAGSRRRSRSASCSPRRLRNAERRRRCPEAMQTYEQMVAERGAEGASATERTREVAGL